MAYELDARIKAMVWRMNSTHQSRNSIRDCGSWLRMAYELDARGKAMVGV